jgi:hypothetical protein
MPEKSLIDKLRSRLPDDHSLKMLDGALKVLEQADNPMRAQQFASTQRELIAHVLEVLAPTADVMRCSWFKQDKGVDGPTRRQRAIYTCRGGLSDSFLADHLQVDPSELHSGFSEAFQKLNKRTHIRLGTVLTDQNEIDDFASETLSALNGIFDTMDELRETVTTAISKELHGEAMSAFINETIEELDILAGRYNTGAVWIDDAKVLSIDADTIKYQVDGTVDVTLMYGGRSDPAEIDENFPYKCTTVAAVGDPTRFDASKTAMAVDTSSWFDED